MQTAPTLFPMPDLPAINTAAAFGKLGEFVALTGNEPFSVTVVLGTMRVSVSVVPITTARESIMEALQLSDVECRIVEALRSAGRALIGKVLAARVNMPHTSTIRTLLCNLTARGVILHNESGYSLPDLTPDED